MANRSLLCRTRRQGYEPSALSQRIRRRYHRSWSRQAEPAATSTSASSCASSKQQASTAIPCAVSSTLDNGCARRADERRWPIRRGFVTSSGTEPSPVQSYPHDRRLAMGVVRSETPRSRNQSPREMPGSVRRGRASAAARPRELVIQARDRKRTGSVGPRHRNHDCDSERILLAQRCQA